MPVVLEIFNEKYIIKMVKNTILQQQGFPIMGELDD